MSKIAYFNTWPTNFFADCPPSLLRPLPSNGPQGKDVVAYNLFYNLFTTNSRQIEPVEFKYSYVISIIVARYGAHAPPPSISNNLFCSVHFETG